MSGYVQEFVGGDAAWGDRKTGTKYSQSDDAVLFHMRLVNGIWYVDACIGRQMTLPQFRQAIYEITYLRFEGAHFTPTVIVEQTYLEDIKVPLSDKYPCLKWNFIGVPLDTTSGAKSSRIADTVRAIQRDIINIQKLPLAFKQKLRDQLDGTNYKDKAGHDDYADGLSLCYVAIRDHL